MNLTERDRKFQQYFTALAPSYAHLTSNTTKLIAIAALDLFELPEHEDAAIHDNAAGPGTATSAIIEKYRKGGKPIPRVYVTDYTPAMIDACREDLKESKRSVPAVEASVEDSQALSFEDSKFDLTFCNISIANLDKPALALKEMLRTTKPGGLVVVTNWRVFGFSGIISEAKTRLTGTEGQPTPVAAPEWMEEGYIAEKMIEAGFRQEGVKTHSVRIVAGDDGDLQGAVEFLTGSFIPIVSTLNDADKPRWKQCVEDTIAERKQRDGGIACEAWVVIAKK